MRVPTITAATTANVTVADFLFTDGASSTTTTTITAGDTVMWTWSGTATHSVTADDNSFDDPAGSAKASGAFGHTFNTPGTFAYYCRVHGAPGGNGMSGTIVVQAAAATSTPTSSPTLPAATDTPPATRTAATGTNTPAATTSPTATNTPAAATATAPGAPLVAGTAVAPPNAPAAVVASAQLPATGRGAGRADVVWRWPSFLLAAAGVVAVAAAIATRRRA
jgi:plastocyanin